MSDDIKAGDVVTCISRCGHPSVPRIRVIQVGEVHRVAAVFPECIDLRGLEDPTYSYLTSHFRKLDAPKTEIADRIRACRPVREQVPA